MYLGVRRDKEMETEKTGIEGGKQMNVIGMMWWGLNKILWKFVWTASDPVRSRPVLGRPGEVTAHHHRVVLSFYFHYQLPVHSWPSWCTSIEHQGTKPAVQNPVLIAFFTFQWLPLPLEYISPERTPFTTEYNLSLILSSVHWSSTLGRELLHSALDKHSTPFALNYT